MERIDAVAKKVIDGLGIKNTIESYYVLSIWGRVVGDTLASMCQPVRVTNHVLFLAVKDSMWSYQITNKYAASIIEKVNNYMKKKMVKRLNCIVDARPFLTPEQHSSKKGRSVQIVEKYGVTQEQIQIETIDIDRIEDEEVRSAFISYIRAKNEVLAE